LVGTRAQFSVGGGSRFAGEWRMFLKEQKRRNESKLNLGKKKMGDIGME